MADAPTIPEPFMIRVMRSASVGQARISFMPPSGTERTLTCTDVRFTPKSGHQDSAVKCPFSAKSRQFAFVPPMSA
jgi:hypothetical protein